MTIADSLRTLLGTVLQIGARADRLEADSGLLGALPELDSMAVASLLTAIEEEFDIIIDDDEISAETFASFGALCDFIARKTSLAA
ncbi:MAG: phosphopantetheine-binding protein [Pseudomonadota bacterium]